jgi:hypothetical protein
MSLSEHCLLRLGYEHGKEHQRMSGLFFSPWSKIHPSLLYLSLRRLISANYHTMFPLPADLECLEIK